jgi:hypothetical protein
MNSKPKDKPKKGKQTDLEFVLNSLNADWKDEIKKDATMYILADIGKASIYYGKPKLNDRYEGVNAVIPLRRNITDSIAFGVNGLEFSSWVQLDSGLIVEQYVAQEANMTHNAYNPSNRMYLLGSAKLEK